MRLLRFIGLLLFLVQINGLQAQERFFNYVPGWINNFSTETDDGYLLLGLGSNQPGHFFQYNEIDFFGNLVSEYTYAIDSVSYTSSFKSSQRGVRLDDGIYSVGLFGNPAGGNVFYGGLFRHDISNGETQLVKSYNDNEYGRLECIALKDDTSFLTAGIYSNNFNISTLIFRETDLEGNIQWSFEEDCNGNCSWFSHTILPLSNGHSALLVNSFNGNFGPGNDREKSILIVVDEEGEEVWRVEPGNPDDYKTLPGGLLEIDGNILLCYTDPFFYDESGEWQTHLEGSIYFENYSLDGTFQNAFDLDGDIPNAVNYDSIPNSQLNVTQIQLLPDGNLVLSGHNVLQSFLYKMTPEGEIIWDRYYSPNPIVDYPMVSQSTEIYHTLQTSDGGFLCTGQYFTFPFELEPEGQQTAFALKVDQYGCLEEGCQGSLNSSTVSGAEKRLKLWPNPAQDQLYVALPAAEQAQSIQFIDGTGRTALTLANRPVSENRLELDLSPLPAGFYLLRLTTQAGEVYSGKVVVE